jgi:hypothetical protein
MEKSIAYNHKNMSGMQILMLFNIMFLLLFGCKPKSGLDAVEYVKIYTIHDADSLTTLNKGVSTFQFFYLDTDNDSLIFRDSHISYERNDSVFPMKRITLAGLISDTVNLDSLNQLIHLLQHRSSGNINNPEFFNGRILHGPHYFIEIKDSKGIHNYDFTLDDNDTLENFSYFFQSISLHNWNLNQIDNAVLNGDSVVIDLYKRIGIYDSMPEPYLGKDCAQEINFSEINGTWRSINTIHDVDSDNYYLLKTTNKQSYHFEQFKNGKFIQSTIPGQYKINQNDSSFELIGKNKNQKYLIIKLTTDCFEFKEIGRNRLFKYSKIR